MERKGGREYPLTTEVFASKFLYIDASNFEELV